MSTWPHLAAPLGQGFMSRQVADWGSDRVWKAEDYLESKTAGYEFVPAPVPDLIGFVACFEAWRNTAPIPMLI